MEHSTNLQNAEHEVKIEENTLTYYKNKLLGKGDFGEVYEGLFNGMKVAVKRVVSSEYKERESLVETLSHPHLVKYFKIWKNAEPEFVFIAMEFCAGTLEDVIQKTYNGPSPGPIERLLLQTSHGLEYLHSKKIIHRDVKPRNILISAVAVEGVDRPVTKIADFGLCKKNSGGSFSKSASEIGPPEWAAPECLNADDTIRICYSADVFSLGCVFGYALTGGSHPFGDEHRADKITKGEIEWRNEHLIKNEKIRKMIRSMISEKPEQRPPLAEEIIPKTLEMCREVNARETLFFFHIELGAGGFGIVFEGLLHGKKVAVKRILRDDYRNIEDEFLELAHPNLVRYHAIRKDTNFVYITMEFCAGTLEDVICNKYDGPSPGSMEKLLLQTSLGLQFLHSKNIVYRDVKPRNILVSAFYDPFLNGVRPIAKLADFGLCKLRNGDDSYFSKSSPIVGTSGWAAPESFNEDVRKIKFSADVFSLGCVFGYALTGGSHPFGGEGMLLQNSKILKGQVDWRNEHAIEKKETRAMIRAMIERSPEERPSLSVIIRQLSSLTGEPFDNVNFMLLSDKRAHTETSMPKVTFSSSEIPDEEDLGDGFIRFPKKKLGRGNFGIVHEGNYKTPDGKQQRIAIKLLFKFGLDDAKTVAETTILDLHIFHEHIVRYIKKLEKNHIVYIAMELCAGTLDDLIKKNKDVPSPGSMELILLQTALGVQHLHSCKIVHCDIKPANILVSIAEPPNRPVMKIADFGLSNKIKNDEGISKDEKPSKLGFTHVWAAPEVLSKRVKEASFSMDVFSLGCVFGYALTDASHPFGSNKWSMTKNIINGTIDWERKSLIANHSIKPTIIKMINKEPNGRPKILEIVEILQEITRN